MGATRFTEGTEVNVEHDDGVVGRFLALQARARMLRVTDEHTLMAVAELETMSALGALTAAWLELLRQPFIVLFDAVIADDERGSSLRRSMPSALRIQLPSHRSDERLMEMAKWQIEAGRPSWCGDGDTFDPIERQREKELSRQRDEHDLQAGRVTPAELRVRNEFLHGIDLKSAEIVISDCERWPQA